MGKSRKAIDCLERTDGSYEEDEDWVGSNDTRRCMEAHRRNGSGVSTQNVYVNLGKSKDA